MITKTKEYFKLIYQIICHILLVDYFSIQENEIKRYGWHWSALEMHNTLKYAQAVLKKL